MYCVILQQAGPGVLYRLSLVMTHFSFTVSVVRISLSLVQINCRAYVVLRRNGIRKNKILH